MRFLRNATLAQCSPRQKTHTHPVAMATKLYVGNLPWDTTEATLRELFSTCGTVLSVELPVGRNGRSRGYGLIEFGSPAEAAASMQSLNGAWWRVAGSSRCRRQPD